MRLSRSAGINNNFSGSAKCKENENIQESDSGKRSPLPTSNPVTLVYHRLGKKVWDNGKYE
jgi:hypothetical protein